MHVTINKCPVIIVIENKRMHCNFINGKQEAAEDKEKRNKNNGSNTSKAILLVMRNVYCNNAGLGSGRICFTFGP